MPGNDDTTATDDSKHRATDGAGHPAAEREYITSPPDTAPTIEHPLAVRVRNALPTPARAGRYAIAIGLALLWILPFVGLLMASFRPLGEILDGWWHLQGATFTLENYRKAMEFQTTPMDRAMLNTLIVTIPSVLVVTLLGAMAAYPFSRFDFPLKKTLFFLIIMVMAAPPELVAMGNYNTLRASGMFDTYLGLILVHIGWGMGWVVLFLRNYLLGIPEELEEAARIDGASRYQIFRTIILPLAAPALVSVAVIQFTWVWNAFFFPLVFLRSPELYVAPQVLPLMKGRLRIDWGLVAAGSVLTMAVPVLIFAVLQRYYKRGMVAAVAD